MGEPGNGIVKRIHSLFVDDLKVYQESHNALKNVSEIIVQASHDTGACYGMSKCAEIIFEHGQMVRGEGLHMLEERMKTMAYSMNICRFNVSEMKELDQMIKKELQGKNMLGKQTSDERLNQKR